MPWLTAYSLQHWPLWLWFCLHSFTITNVKTTGKKEGFMAFGGLFCFVLFRVLVPEKET